ncbi:sulfotransferase [Gemmatimonadota bacterium]
MKDEHKSLGHPLSTGSLVNTVRLLWRNGGVNPRYTFRALSILLSNLFLLPARSYEKWKWADAIDRVEINEPPIFIIGTWRSGTTYLHDILARDKGLGFISTLQAFCPDICIEGSRFLVPLFRMLLPPKRPMDNMRMALEYPQEEEYSMANLSPYSFYHGYTLPGRMSALFDQLTFTQESGDTKQAWQAVYERLLKKMTLIQEGRRLILKNPLNTMRIPALLEMFPEAKFIYLNRNPYLVFYSLLHNFTRLTDAYQLERIPAADLEENVFRFYDRMMQVYGETKDMISPGNLVEVRFENLEADALAVVEGIYTTLNMPGFPQAEEAMRNYIDSQSDYEKNRYEISQEMISTISQRWSHIINRLDYAPPSSI